MNEPRKVWVCLTEAQAERLLRSAFVDGDDSLSEPIRAALARKPDEEPWEGWTSVEDRDDPEAQTVWYEPQAMAAAGFTMMRVLVVPLPEEADHR